MILITGALCEVEAEKEDAEEQKLRQQLQGEEG